MFIPKTFDKAYNAGYLKLARRGYDNIDLRGKKKAGGSKAVDPPPPQQREVVSSVGEIQKGQQRVEKIRRERRTSA